MTAPAPQKIPNETTVREMVVRAIAIYGSEQKLGDVVGCTQNCIWRAKTLGRVSPALAAGIHRATRGKINKHDLRPDLFGPRPRARRRTDGESQQGTASQE